MTGTEGGGLVSSGSRGAVVTGCYEQGKDTYSSIT